MFLRRRIPQDYTRYRDLCQKLSGRKLRRTPALFALPNTRNTCRCKCCRNRIHRHNTRTNTAICRRTARHCIVYRRPRHYKRHPNIHRRGPCHSQYCHKFRRFRCLFSPRYTLGTSLNTSYHNKRHPHNTQMYIAQTTYTQLHWPLSAEDLHYKRPTHYTRPDCIHCQGRYSRQYCRIRHCFQNPFSLHCMLGKPPCKYCRSRNRRRNN